MKTNMIGIDLAKDDLQVCRVNQAGKQVSNKLLPKKKLINVLVTKYPDATIAMEACSGSNPLARSLEALNFKVLLIPPQHVKPFVKGNKNDRNDAFAITEAARRPNMQFVKPKTLEQTDLIQVHKLRERKVREKVALTNQLRGFLREYGITVPKGFCALKRVVLAETEFKSDNLTVNAKELFKDVYQEWLLLDKRIDELGKKLKQLSRVDNEVKRLMTLKGVGEITATAFKATIGDGAAFKSGRHCAANLGLVPKEHSSGGKQKLGGITKRGNGYLRRLLVQCAHTVLNYASRSNDKLSCWAKKVEERRGKSVAAVAVANKMARILWSMAYHQTNYDGATKA